jgi:hypothetical protein
MTRDQNYPQGKEQQNLTGQTTSQIRTITFKDVTAPWSRRNHLMRTRLLPQVMTAITSSPEPLKNQN